MAYNPNRPSFGTFGFAMTPWVKRILIANVAVFFVTLLIPGTLVFEWFGFTPSRALTRPWGAITYMFVHGGFWHLLVNMLVLFFFGPPLESRWGSREFLKFYVICGLGGVALSFLFAFGSGPVVGASAAIYGVMLAFAMTWPEAPIYIYGIFPVKAKWLAVFLFVLSFLSAFAGQSDGVAHFAHLGGFLTGFLYLKMDWRGSDKLDRLKRATKVRRLAIVPREESDEEPESAGRRMRPRREEALLDRVDEILDKISAHGMSSLSPEELRILDEVSKRHRTN